jgi:hypothetical protein
LVAQGQATSTTGAAAVDPLSPSLPAVAQPPAIGVMTYSVINIRRPSSVSASHSRSSVKGHDRRLVDLVERRNAAGKA